MSKVGKSSRKVELRTPATSRRSPRGWRRPRREGRAPRRGRRRRQRRRWTSTRRLAEELSDGEHDVSRVLRPLDLPRGDRAEWDRLIRNVPAAWQAECRVGGLPFLRRLAEHRGGLTKRSDVVRLLTVFQTEATVVARFCAARGDNPDPSAEPEKYQEIPLFRVRRPHRRESPPWLEQDRLSAAEIAAWVGSGTQIKERIATAAAAVDPKENRQKTDIESWGRVLLLLTDELHVEGWARMDVTEFVVRRLMFLIRLGEKKLAGTQRSEAWRAAEGFLGVTGGTSAEGQAAFDKVFNNNN